MALDHLIFDATDATTMADTHSVGAYLRDAAGNLITSQANGSQRALDVGINVAGVQIDPRQVRALTNTDVVTAEQGTSPWVVSATNLDIRDLVFATDKVDVSGSTVELGATTLAALETITVLQGTSPWVVSATDLDIRNIDYTQDNIAIKGATGNQLVVNADGSLNVNADISVVNGSDKAEDSAHASGDIGTYILGVRQDTLASSTSADGDYGSLKTSAAGALYVNLAESTATITTSDAALANTAISNAAKTLAAADTAEATATSILASRKYLFVYNNDNTKIFVGSATVSAANGFPISPGSYMEMRAGAAVSPFFVGQSGKTPEIRTLQLS